LTLLIALQFLITWLSVRSSRFQAIIKAEPTLLLSRGRFLDGALKAERMTREEVLAAMRADGVSDVASVAAVVLETDGSVSIISGTAADDHSTLGSVSRHGDAEQ
jgi:uncharacterized membrane protein YcaP (DUF421 family)